MNQKETVTLDDIFRLIGEIRMGRDDSNDIKGIAFHEAGHAVAGIQFLDGFVFADIHKKYDGNGGILGGLTQLTKTAFDNDIGKNSPDIIRRYIIVKYAGYAAECKYHGRKMPEALRLFGHGGTTDFQQAAGACVILTKDVRGAMAKAEEMMKVTWDWLNRPETWEYINRVGTALFEKKRIEGNDPSTVGIPHLNDLEMKMAA